MTTATKASELILKCEECGSILHPSASKGLCYCIAAHSFDGCGRTGLYPMTPKERQRNMKALWLEQFPAMRQADHLHYCIEGHSGKWRKAMQSGSEEAKKALRQGSQFSESKVYGHDLMTNKVYEMEQA